MTPEQFVECCVEEKQFLLAAYMDPNSGSGVAESIASMKLSPEQRTMLKNILDGALTDTFYTLILALEGAASLGGKQVRYSLRDEEGAELTGKLEGMAWQAFHGSQQ
jgi:hypothetical protein